jgi:hypothetical protein
LPKSIRLLTKAVNIFAFLQFPVLIILIYQVYGLEGFDRLLVLVIVIISALFFIFSSASLLSNKDDLKISLSLTQIIFLFGLIGFDQYLSSKWTTSRLAILAEQRGISFDKRSLPDVVLDDRAAGKITYPDLTPRNFYERPISLEGIKYVPLAGLPLVETVLCNESGQYVRFKSDRFGFNNPDSIWNDKTTFDVALIGDSFAQGWCVAQGDSIVANLNREKIHSVSFGHGGLGPIGTFALIREYVTKIKPKFVIWLWYEGNDYYEFEAELSHKILSQYVNKTGWHQALYDRRDKISLAMKKRGNIELERREKIRWFPLIRWRATTADKSVVAYWRNYFSNSNLTKEVPKIGEIDSTQKQLYLKLLGVIQQGMTEIKELEAKPIFIYLPDHANFKTRSRLYSDVKKALFKTLKARDVVAIDMREEFRLRDMTADEIFPLPAQTHYTEAGHKAVANVIKKSIQLSYGGHPREK